MSSFDVIVIGAGPAGYVCAIKAAQLGLSVACIEKRKTLGGTCLNVGCIPSKALLNSSEKYVEAKDHFKDYGIKVGDVSVDLSQMMKQKEDVVEGLTKGIAFLFKKNKVEHIIGTAKITAPGKVNVEGKEFTAKNIVIATGSDVMPLPGVEIDETVIVSSTGALSLTAVPKKMVVIGAGYIGLEMGSVWQRLGAEVTVIEYLDVIAPTMDQDCAAELQKILEKQGIQFKLGTKVEKIEKKEKGALLQLQKASGGETETFECDVALISIGRKPHTEGLGLEDLGVKMNERGMVEVNSSYQTSVEGIYAIGDVIPGPMLAHKGEEEGVAVAEILSGKTGHVNYGAIPGVVYTYPEVASVGKTEQELKEEGVSYAVGKFPLMANSRARAMGLQDGFVKILTQKETDRILGVHIIGPEAGTMIAEAVLALEYHASSEDIARTCHAHPTLNEALKEAALAAHDKPLHS